MDNGNIVRDNLRASIEAKQAAEKPTALEY